MVLFFETDRLLILSIFLITFENTFTAKWYLINSSQAEYTIILQRDISEFAVHYNDYTL